MNGSSTSTIIQILRDVAPDECDDVGDYYVQLLVEDKTEFVQPKGSSNVDLTTTLATLATLVSIAKTGMEIYFLLKEKMGRKPTVAELSNDLNEKVRSNNQDTNLNNKEIVNSIAQSICKSN